MKQLKLFSTKTEIEHGGSLIKGKRKTARPLDTKRPIHIVPKADSDGVLLENRAEVEGILKKYADKFGVRIYTTGLHDDHLHAVIVVPSRELYNRWIRGTTAVLTRRFPKAKWKLRPYTKLASWGRSFEVLKTYIRKNQAEGELISYAFGRAEGFRRQIEEGMKLN